MKDFLERMKSLLGGEFDAWLKIYNSDDVFRGLRVNTLKCSADKLREHIGFELRQTPFCLEGFYIPSDISGIGNLPLHHAGAFYVQEPSATSAVTMLGVEKGDKVLDLCAAPGGKSTQIASALGGEGLLWSNEIVRNRAIILLSNIERMGVKNAVVSNCRPDILCDKLTGYFDKVLVDAPCSGEGMFRKNSAAEEWSAEHVKSCADRQLKILNSAKRALKQNGVMVYSTCTFSREENEGVVEEFLKQNPDFEIEDSGVSFGRPTLDYARRIFPMDGGEGHFAVRLRKNGAEMSVPEVRNNPSKLPDFAEDFIGEWVFYLIAAKDGRTMTREEMLATEQVDDKANVTISEDALIIYAPSTGELEPVKVEFNAENGSLKVINEEADSTVVLYLTDNGMLVFFEPDDETREGAVYLVRIEEENG